MFNHSEHRYQQWWLPFVIHSYSVCRVMGRSFSRKYPLIKVHRHVRQNLGTSLKWLSSFLDAIKSNWNKAFRAGCAVPSMNSLNHLARGNGLPEKLWSSVRVLSFHEMTGPKWKDTSALIKLSFYCLHFVCFLANPSAASAFCAGTHFPGLCREANPSLWRLLSSIAWSKYHSSIAI